MSNISEFYRDKVVFVTGGTGFIGKIVVEKLLRSCGVKEVILMVREKKNTQPEQRIKTLCSSPVSRKPCPKIIVLQIGLYNPPPWFVFT
ncbi:hypothetical protein ZHAS_00008252 [Anopheles sinensis]|uniref:Fatty acyl-CoA reductase n=1 Tax=Anopheles sinensis TaxID=74873 RepID=A0A084VS73_ANOSI|nr:hypothetical protein ZHAS_00008252 [Anopheles sinensis]